MPTTRRARNASFAATTPRADTGCESVSASVPCSRSSERTLKLRASTSSGSRYTTTKARSKRPTIRLSGLSTSPFCWNDDSFV